MGQANRRGTVNERKQAAKARNTALLANLRDTGQAELLNYATAHGTQRLATKLVAAGYMKPPTGVVLVP